MYRSSLRRVIRQCFSRSRSLAYLGPAETWLPRNPVWLAHSVPTLCRANLGLLGHSSVPSRNGTGWIDTNLVMYLQFTQPPGLLIIPHRLLPSGGFAQVADRPDCLSELKT